MDEEIFAHGLLGESLPKIKEIMRLILPNLVSGDFTTDYYIMILVMSVSLIYENSLTLCHFCPWDLVQRHCCIHIKLAEKFHDHDHLYIRYGYQSCVIEALLITNPKILNLTDRPTELLHKV